MSKRAIGDVRPSQVITTFGPGAIVDLQTLSIIVAGIDGWPIDEDKVIHEPRLAQALGVKRFFPALRAEGGFYSKRGTVPSYIFPRFQVCPVCNTLSEIGGTDTEYEEKWQEIKCKAPGCRGQGRFRAATLPAPFITACPSGHLDDFPWRRYVHRGAVTCARSLKLYSVGRTGTVMDLWVECACGAKRSIGDAFGEQQAEALGDCTRRRPWLGLGNTDTNCQHQDKVRALQRGATNAWFPILRSTLKIQEATSPIGIALSKCPAHQIEKIDAADKLKTLMEMGMFPPLDGFAVDDIWSTIRKMRGELETDEVDLRWPEWEALRSPESYKDERAELFLEETEVPTFVKGLISRVILARKLLEVRALTGFTRVDYAAGAADDESGPGIAPIYRNRPDWLPAVEVRGEGIFLELDTAALATWEAKTAVRERARAMAEKYAAWEHERGVSGSPFPGARYALLHTLAHALIRQLSLDCGYSASAVRERIYSSTDPKRPMAGVLLYTASPDSEGSLGGLVDLGSPARFPDLLLNALRSATRCSSDPLCADHKPDVHGTINGAACHACVLLPETSCESFNRFLDRNFLAQTIAHDAMAFFADVLKL